MIIAGVMSGSSLDGLDIAVVQFRSNNDWQLLWSYDIPYTQEWVNRLKNYHQQSSKEYVSLKFDYSRYIGQLVDDALRKFSERIDYLSFHGHTLMHLPEKGITEQIGNGGVIAATVNIPTITDFRTQDVTKGGVGTPIAPLVELNLFQGHDFYLNLGGIANITKIAESGKLIAYDVCPCNQVLNYFSNQIGREYDKGGEIARSGSIDHNIINYLDSISYFHQPPPKSLDNNWIMNEVISNFPMREVADTLHTFCHWMSNCIAKEIESSSKSTSIMVSGGGAHNTYFMECLQKTLAAKNCELVIPSKEVIDFKEAILMSLMAYKYVKGEPNVLSTVTGASSDSIGGALYKIG